MKRILILNKLYHYLDTTDITGWHDHTRTRILQMTVCKCPNIISQLKDFKINHIDMLTKTDLATLEQTGKLVHRIEHKFERFLSKLN